MRLWGGDQRSNLAFTPEWSGGIPARFPYLERQKTPLTVPKRREPKEKTHIPEHPVPGLADMGGHVL